MKAAIIGGSITEEAGASNYKNTYVYKLEKYFKEKDKNSLIKNLGAGGTSSQFGLFRLKRDLGDFNPDVIFIEFAVNDRIYSSYDISIYFEGLVRECLKITDKVIIIDFPTAMGDSSTSIHKKIAYFHNVPVIDVQDEVWKKIGDRGFKWPQISIDDLHPNDNGHNIYYEIIRDNLDGLDMQEVKEKFEDATLMPYKFNNPKIVSYDELEFYGHWREESFNLNNKFNKSALTETINDGVIFKFNGKYLSMLNLLTQNSGILECQLDNFVFNIDLYNASEGYFNTTININDLENKEHTLMMRVSEKKNDKSLGNKIIIGGFLVEN